MRIAPLLAAGFGAWVLFAAGACSVIFSVEGYDQPRTDGGSAGGTGGDASAKGGAGGTGGVALPVCACYRGARDYCSTDALAHAMTNACAIPVETGSALLHCEGDAWTVAGTCSGACDVTPKGYAYCVPQGVVCGCWAGQGRYCEQDAASHAAADGCEIPLLTGTSHRVLSCVCKASPCMGTAGPACADGEGTWDVAAECANVCCHNDSGGDYCPSGTCAADGSFKPCP